MTVKPLGQDEGLRRVAGLQATQALLGFLLHEELVPGAPAGHRLPGAGHGVRGGKVAPGLRGCWLLGLGLQEALLEQAAVLSAA